MSAKLIYAYLLKNPDGATVEQMSHEIQRRPRDVKAGLAVLRPCIQIDRWDGDDEPVWALVVPQDCPRPDRKATA